MFVEVANVSGRKLPTLCCTSISSTLARRSCSLVPMFPAKCLFSKAKCPYELKKTSYHWWNLDAFNKGSIRLVELQHDLILRWRFSCVRSSCSQSSLSDAEYDNIAEETLQSLSDFFDTLAEHKNCPDEFDSSYSMGVLTVKFGAGIGTYVINKQSPNKQIWFSSPISGPKRYDFTGKGWIYAHTGGKLHDLLTEEVASIVNDNSIKFSECKHS